MKTPSLDHKPLFLLNSAVDNVLVSPPTTAFHFKTLNIIVKALEGGLSYV